MRHYTKQIIKIVINKLKNKINQQNNKINQQNNKINQQNNKIKLQEENIKQNNKNKNVYYNFNNTHDEMPNNSTLLLPINKSIAIYTTFSITSE